MERVICSPHGHVGVPKFGEGELVEVLQLEKGLRGSWHAAIVIGVKPGRRIVEYEELLTEDGLNKLIESIPVSRSADGGKPPTRQPHKIPQKKLRALVRPRPPPLPDPTPDKWTEGMWVDCFYQDAWWEGILVNDVRTVSEPDTAGVDVYFPEETDWEFILIKDMRIGLEWDEDSGRWTSRNPMSPPVPRAPVSGAPELPKRRGRPPGKSANKKFIRDLQIDVSMKLDDSRALGAEDTPLVTSNKDNASIRKGARSSGRRGDASEILPISNSLGDPVLATSSIDEKSSCSGGFTQRNLVTDQASAEQMTNGEVSNVATLDLGESGLVKGDTSADADQVCIPQSGAEVELLKEDAILHDATVLPCPANCSPIGLTEEVLASEKEVCRQPDTAEELDVEGDDEDNPTLSRLTSCKRKKRKQVPSAGEVKVLEGARPHWISEVDPVQNSQGFHFGLRSLVERNSAEPKQSDNANSYGCTSAHVDNCTVELDLGTPVNSKWDTLDSVTVGDWAKVRGQKRRKVGNFSEGGKGLKKSPSLLLLNCDSKEATKSALKGADGTASVRFRSKKRAASGEVLCDAYKAERKSLEAKRGVSSNSCFEQEPQGKKSRGATFEANLSPETKSRKSVVTLQQNLNCESKSRRKSKGIKSSLDKKSKKSRGRPGYRLEVLLCAPAKSRDPSFAEGEAPSFKRRTILSWLIDLGVILENEKVRYLNRKDMHSMGEGVVNRDGVICCCCGDTITLSAFESHCGSKLHRPSANIFLSDGRSLSECQAAALKLQDMSKGSESKSLENDDLDKSDDTCGVCGDGGDLICCDHCPSTFHLDCLKMQAVPEGDWYCWNCRCCICGRSQFNSDGSKDQLSVLSCNQCEHKYHVDCLQLEGEKRLSSEGEWFCRDSCGKIFRELRGLVGTTKPLDGGYSWTLLRSGAEDAQIQSTVSGVSRNLDLLAEFDSKLSIAHSVMQECFKPMIDPRTKINLISQVLYNRRSEVNRLDYHGFYTMLLERGDELISVATIRVHGERVAEMPLIGTRYEYRRQGMCRRLMIALEQMLSVLGVQTLVLPAVPELLPTWSGAFGFQPLSEAQRIEMVDLNIMAFPGTTLLHKRLALFDIAQNKEELSGASMDNCTRTSKLEAPAIEARPANVVIAKRRGRPPKKRVPIIKLKVDQIQRRSINMREIVPAKDKIMAPEGGLSQDAGWQAPASLGVHPLEVERVPRGKRGQMPRERRLLKNSGVVLLHGQNRQNYASGGQIYTCTDVAPNLENTSEDAPTCGVPMGVSTGDTPVLLCERVGFTRTDELHQIAAAVVDASNMAVAAQAGTNLDLQLSHHVPCQSNLGFFAEQVGFTKSMSSEVTCHMTSSIAARTPVNVGNKQIIKFKRFVDDKSFIGENRERVGQGGSVVIRTTTRSKRKVKAPRWVADSLENMSKNGRGLELGMGEDNNKHCIAKKKCVTEIPPLESATCNTVTYMRRKTKNAGESSALVPFPGSRASLSGSIPSARVGDFYSGSRKEGDTVGTSSLDSFTVREIFNGLPKSSFTSAQQDMNCSHSSTETPLLTDSSPLACVVVNRSLRGDSPYIDGFQNYRSGEQAQLHPGASEQDDQGRNTVSGGKLFVRLKLVGKILKEKPERSEEQDISDVGRFNLLSLNHALSASEHQRLDAAGVSQLCGQDQLQEPRPVLYAQEITGVVT